MPPLLTHTRWQISSLPAPALPVTGIPRERWQVELMRSLTGNPVTLTLEACDDSGHLHLPADQWLCKQGSSTLSANTPVVLTGCEQ